MPLKGIKVLEFAGLAPGPFCGKFILNYYNEYINANIICFVKRYDFIRLWSHSNKNRQG